MKKEKIIIISTILLMVVISLVGFTYAYFQSTSEQLITNTLETGCMELDFEEANEGIYLKNAYPITDEEGMALTPYTFTLTNNCTIFTKYTIALEVLDTTTLSVEYIDLALNQDENVKLNSLPITTATIDGATAFVLQEGNMAQGDTITNNLRIWMSEDVTVNDDVMNKIFNAKVTIAAVPNEFTVASSGITKLSDFLLANEYQISDVEEAKRRIEDRGEPDFSITSPVTLYEESYNSTIKTSVNKTRTTAYVSTTYSINKYTGYFSVIDPILVYYTDLSLDEGNTYYTCGTQDSVNDINGSIGYNRSQTCRELYQITSVSSSSKEEETFYSIDGIVIKANTVETSTSDGGVFATKDETGTTYYYRGLVTNNNVYFGGFYWKIVRINGDGSIRLIYNGKTADAFGSNSLISESAFNEDNTKPLFVGYMYGNSDGTTLNEVNANTYDSTIKNVIDTWYENNLLNTSYESYLADSIFCNDRSFHPDTKGDGILTTPTTDYSSRYRLIRNKNPQLTCNQNDAFTKDNEIGNKALTYPIALLTADEAALAGYTNGYLNPNTYLHIGKYFWGMTPAQFSTSTGSAYAMITTSIGNFDQTRVSYEYGVRPVINLKSEVLVTGGNGTSNDPFTVAMPE